jgi:arginase family enzyme
MPAGINNLRIGEAILQGGRDTFHYEPWRDLDRDAFRLTGELLEVKIKPSVPIGTTGVDAFGKRPVFEDKGDRRRGILNIGREDVVVEGLIPTDPRVAVLGASSDHLILDLTEAFPTPDVGSLLSFHMTYGALLAAMTSEYVEKDPVLDQTPKKPSRVRLIVDADLRTVIDGCKYAERLAALRLEPTIHVVDQNDVGSIIASQVAAASAENGVPLLLGKERSTTFAGLQALSRCVDAFGLLWFDARPSFALPASGGTRDAAEMVLSRALGYDPNVPSTKPQLSPESVVLIGLRDVTPHEAEIIRDSRVTVFTIADIDALGIREVMRQALRVAMAGTRGLYVSYCPAVTDIPGVADGSGGITLRETHQAMEIVAQTCALLAMDVIGLGPNRESRLNAEAANFVMSCFGKQIL